MLKKTLILATIVVLVVSCMVSPVSAAGADWTIDFTDYIENLDVDGDTGIVTVVLPLEYCATEIKYVNGKTLVTYGGDTLVCDLVADTDYQVNFYLLSAYPIYLGNLPDGTEVTINADVLSLTTGMYGTPKINWYATYFDNSKTRLSQTVLSGDRNSFDGVISATGSINKPSGAYAANFGLACSEFCPLESGTFKFDLYGIELKFPVSSLFVDDYQNKQNQALIKAVQTELESQGKTLDSVLEQQQQTNEKLDELPGEIGNEFQDIIDKENQEASDAGDSAAGELMDIIPNESEGFMTAIQSLVSSMSYNGTEAKLPIPAIVLPEISGVMDELQLTDELEIDFGYWIEKLPSDILQLVRILCTIALIGYCFKELYSTISYAMTLKGGGGGE